MKLRGEAAAATLATKVPSETALLAGEVAPPSSVVLPGCALLVVAGFVTVTGLLLATPAWLSVTARDCKHKHGSNGVHGMLKS